jgi:Zn-dependent protease/CBS domain-containing protein
LKSSIRLFRIAGIDIGIHYSWILIFIFFATTLALGFFPTASPDKTTSTYWAAGILASLLLFASVLAHELAHSLVAQARGIPVRSITLFIFGGVSNLEQEAEKPGVEFLMAIVGPGASLLLSIVFWILFQAMQPGDLFADFFRFGGWLPQSSIIGAGFFYLALINISLAAFNLLPGFPLDGGRVLRSIVWGITGNLVRATNIATAVGRLFGWGLIAIGVLNILGYTVWIFGASLVGGIWIAFIGWFLSSAAESSRTEATMRERMAGIKVKDAMVQSQDTISPQTTVAELVQGVFNQRYRRAVPVCQDDRTLGIVTISDVKGLPQEKWAVTPVEQIMTRSPLYSVSPDDDLSTAMKLIAQHDLNQVLVMNGDLCSGLLTRAEIIRYLQLSQELKVKSKGKSG